VVLWAVYLLRPNRVLLILTAVMVALPAFTFFKWSAVTSPQNTLYLLNHIALLLAGVLAVASIIQSFLPRGRDRA
jgi:hypothetical protein